MICEISSTMSSTISFGRFSVTLLSVVLIISSVQCRNLAHLSGSLGIIDDIMHYGAQNATVAVRDSLSKDLKSDELIFVETKPVDRRDFVHWEFHDDEIVKVEEGRYVSSYRRIDMSDFVKLIPSEEVKAIVARYYKNDMEVQRGYAYLRSEEFNSLKEKIVENPDMNNFLNYFNRSGLDVVGFIYALTNLTGTPEEYPIQVGDDINANSTMSGESLNGLHGLVDSILDILPQDQILSLFFDKLETSEEFSKLVENIGSPEFERILQKLQNSIALRNLVYTLHNNGIYITRILDSLKAYFFLGTF